MVDALWILGIAATAGLTSYLHRVVGLLCVALMITAGQQFLAYPAEVRLPCFLWDCLQLLDLPSVEYSAEDRRKFECRF